MTPSTSAAVPSTPPSRINWWRVLYERRGVLIGLVTIAACLHCAWFAWSWTVLLSGSVDSPLPVLGATMSAAAALQVMGLMTMFAEAHDAWRTLRRKAVVE